MFNETWPWKRELAACAHRLRDAARETAQKDWPHGAEDDWEVVTEAIFEIERDVMVGSFALRRLLGMPYKVTQSIRKRTIPVVTFPLQPGRSAPDAMDALDAFDWYDLTQPTVQCITTQQMCNLFVHSHVLHFAWDLESVKSEEQSELKEDDARLEGPLELGGFFVATDTTSKTHLTRVDLDVLANSFEEMAEDDVVLLEMRRDHRGRRYLSQASSSLPEDYPPGALERNGEGWG